VNGDANGPETDLTLADVERLEDLLSRDALLDLCGSLFALFAVPIRVLSTSGALLAEVRVRRASCALVNDREPGREACASCVGATESLDPEPPSTRHGCFTGAVYQVIPIDYQGRRLGRFVVGPYLPAELTEVPQSLLRVVPDVDPERAREALDELPRMSRETADRLVGHVRGVVDLILFSGHRAALAQGMHLATVRESYRELAQKNAALQEAYDKLKELDRLKSNFMATISHELRTPLTSIIGYSDMLHAGLAGPMNPEQTEFVETIRSKGEHLLALITNVLDLSRLEKGSLLPQRELLDAAAVMADVAKTVGPSAAKKRVRVVTAAPAELPPLHADPVMIRQVLFNLVENAVKFSPPGSEVTLSAREVAIDVEAETDDLLGLSVVAARRRGVELTVRDAGPGIAAAEHERIFDAFYQVDGSSTREHGGTGLGLSIVRKLVEAHGGTVWVESELGAGACFRFTVPEVDELG
jgi:signal transduction histidine kinase